MQIKQAGAVGSDALPSKLYFEMYGVASIIMETVFILIFCYLLRVLQQKKKRLLNQIICLHIFVSLPAGPKVLVLLIVLK
jgi:flagellar biogenesis protein FliO